MATTRRCLKDPSGGLTAAGRADFARTDGSHLRPGVKGPADTPEKMKRKGSFLRRHYANPRGPMRDRDDEPTRLALAAHAWGEPVPRTTADARELARKGARLLEDYHAAKDREERPSARAGPVAPKRAARKNSLVENINRRRKAGTSRSKENTTVSRESYDQMRKGWPKSATKKSAKKSAKRS